MDRSAMVELFLHWELLDRSDYRCPICDYFGITTLSREEYTQRAKDCPDIATYDGLLKESRREVGIVGSANLLCADCIAIYVHLVLLTQIK
jgi:hypothetical protein